jgi:hypothetical protein
MEPGDPSDALREPGFAEPATLIVFDMHIVMGLSPVMTHEHPHHRSSLVVVEFRARGDQQLANGSVLEARHPTSRPRSTSPTDRRTI